MTLEFLAGDEARPAGRQRPGGGGGPAGAAALRPLPERPLADHQGRHQHPRAGQDGDRPEPHAGEADHLRVIAIALVVVQLIPFVNLADVPRQRAVPVRPAARSCRLGAVRGDDRRDRHRSTARRSSRAERSRRARSCSMLEDLTSWRSSSPQRVKAGRGCTRPDAATARPAREGRAEPPDAIEEQRRAREAKMRPARSTRSTTPKIMSPVRRRHARAATSRTRSARR